MGCFGEDHVARVDEGLERRDRGTAFVRGGGGVVGECGQDGEQHDGHHLVVDPVVREVSREQVHDGVEDRGNVVWRVVAGQGVVEAAPQLERLRQKQREQ